MQQTEKYQFKLIEQTDTFSPEPLNQNMEAVEEKLAALEGSDAVLTAALGSGGKTARIAWGTYTGNGSYPKKLTFDFKPLLLITSVNSAIVIHIRGYSGGGFYVGSLTSSATAGSVTWGDNSITASSGRISLNDSATSYCYVVLGESL